MTKNKILPLGTKAYAVHKNWISTKPLDGAIIIPCRLTTYVREGGKVLPLYQAGKNELKNHFIFTSLEDAVKKITDKPVKKK
jgi:hypothetical protein